MAYVFKKHLKDLERSRVGIHLGPEISMFLHRNERIIPYDDSVFRLLCKRLRNVRFNLYPDIELFYGKLSKWLGIGERQIFITEGVSGAIKSLIETVCEKGNNVVFPAPTFALYPVYCKMFGLEYRTAGYAKDYRLDVDGLLGLIDDKTAIVFLPNPNVPIEGTLDTNALCVIAKYCAEKKVFLAIDEVYYPFGGPTALGLIDKFDNTFIMRSFSKAFGLAGIRVGYLLGTHDNIEYVSKVRTGYETNSVCAEIVSFFIDNYRFVEEYIRDVKEGIVYLKKEFDKRGLEYNGGQASNFIFVNLHDKDMADKVIGELKKKNIYLRGGWPEPFSGGFSITAGPKPLMKKAAKEIFPLLTV